jgi:hypothetical protein
MKRKNSFANPFFSSGENPAMNIQSKPPVSSVLSAVSDGSIGQDPYMINGTETEVLLTPQNNLSPFSSYSRSDLRVTIDCTNLTVLAAALIVAVTWRVLSFTIVLIDSLPVFI